MTEEYIKKTRRAVGFLCEVYNDDIPVVADIRTAQAEGDTQFLIKELCAVRDFAQSLINELKKYREKGGLTMTREKARKAAEVMLAYADGKEIEYTYSDKTEWLHNPAPQFNWNLCDYRIKKEPTYRPFKDKEECWAEMQKHQPFGWLKEINGNYFLLMCVDNNMGLKESFEDYTFADGAPFGVKVKE